MEYNDAIDYINGTSWTGKVPGLGRITQLLHTLGDPQDKLRFVHIAGTNGKGSCAAMLASVLKAAGYKTGLFTSPYLHRFNERMRINGLEIDDAGLAALVERIKPAADAMTDHPSEFELTTAAAMLYFAETDCGAVVLETGLGGRFDATNVIKAPECCVITNIGLDHTGVLGSTVEEIAGEKAGIIKDGCPCVLYCQSENVMDVIRRACRERKAPLTITQPAALTPGFDSTDGQSFTYKGEEYALPLLGRAQLYNAAACIETVGLLNNRGFSIDSLALEAGLYAVEWPARFEILTDEPYFVLDAAHNPQGIQTTAENLKSYFPHQRRVILIGVMADKNWREMADIMAAVGDEFITVSPQSSRALPAGELAEYIESLGKPVRVSDSVEDGVRMALSMGDDSTMICAVGSIYMAGDIRGCFGLGGKNI